MLMVWTAGQNMNPFVTQPPHLFKGDNIASYNHHGGDSDAILNIWCLQSILKT